MSKLFAAFTLFAFVAFIPAHAQNAAAGAVTSIDDFAAILVESGSEDDVARAIDYGSDAGLSDIQIATAFGLALEYLLQEGPRERLPLLMSSFEAFVADSSESVAAISGALDAGQNLAQGRADAGEAIIRRDAPVAPDALTDARPPESQLQSSPVGRASSAKGATGGGGGGVIFGGASPS